MVPAELTAEYRLLEDSLVVLQEYLLTRLKAELSELSPVAIEPRIKGIESVYDKLQTGRYETLRDLNDLVGLKVVLLRRSLVADAILIARSSLQVLHEEVRPQQPTDFSYSEPHLIVRPPQDFCERHPELAGLSAELQFTTALQHALDMATHDFDYKGQSFSWGNFRIVAQLRGSLELVDNLIDGAESLGLLARQGASVPEEYQRRQQLLEVLAAAIPDDKLPKDQRRMATTVDKWIQALPKTAEELREALERHADLVNSVSLNAVDSVLGVLLRECGDLLVEKAECNFCVSSELSTICEEVSKIPMDRRTRFVSDPPTEAPEEHLDT